MRFGSARRKLFGHAGHRFAVHRNAGSCSAYGKDWSPYVRDADFVAETESVQRRAALWSGLVRVDLRALADVDVDDGQQAARPARTSSSVGIRTINAVPDGSVRRRRPRGRAERDAGRYLYGHSHRDFRFTDQHDVGYDTSQLSTHTVLAGDERFQTIWQVGCIFGEERGTILIAQRGRA